jgi:hypothetical protein
VTPAGSPLRGSEQFVPETPGIINKLSGFNELKVEKKIPKFP